MATPHIKNSMSVNTLRLSLFPLKLAVACIQLPGDGEPPTRSHVGPPPSPHYPDNGRLARD